MPGIRVEIVPFGRGDFFLDLTAIRLGDIVLVHGACSPLMLVAAPAPGTVVLQFPLDHLDTLRLNGNALPPFGFCLYGPGARLVRSNVQANTYAVVTVPAELADAYLSHDALRPLVEPETQLMLSAHERDWYRMARLTRAARDTAQYEPELFTTDPPRAALRAALLDAARGLIAGANSAIGGAGRPADKAWHQVVLGADSYLCSHLDRPIYTEELCQALHISPAVLAEAFRGTLGISPHRYLKLRRLNMVRAALQRRGDMPALVKSVALSHGFWHLGQFAHDYKEQFGETPSDTLAAAGVAGHVAPVVENLAMPATPSQASRRDRHRIARRR